MSAAIVAMISVGVVMVTLAYFHDNGHRQLAPFVLAAAVVLLACFVVIGVTAA